MELWEAEVLSGDAERQDHRAAVVQELSGLAVVPLNINCVGSVGGLYNRDANRVELGQQLVASDVDGPNRSARPVRSRE